MQIRNVTSPLGINRTGAPHGFDLNQLGGVVGAAILNMTQQDMNITQNQVSTGLAVSTAADNAAYWSIGQQLTSASDIETAANTALQQSQAIMDTANSAISSVITTIDAIQAAITGASNPGASFADINSSLASLSSQLSEAINGASFDGVNLLNGTSGTTSTGTSTPMSFVAGYNASASGGAISTVAFTAQALIGGTNVAGQPTVAAPATTVVTDTNFATTLEGLTGSGAMAANANAAYSSPTTR